MLEIAKVVVEWVLKDVLSPLLTWLFDPKNWPWPALPVFLILTASVGIVVIAVVGLGEPSGCQLTPVPQNIAFLEKFEEFKDCACCPPMVVLPHGSYQMGKHVNEADNKECAISDAKLVEIDKTFAMSKYEIRVKEFRAFKEHQHNIYSKILAPLKSYVTSDVNNEEFGCHHFQREGDQGRHDENMQLSWQRTGSIQTDEHPVVCVNWVQANQYANWLRQKTGQRYELPTTKEWEYAARSGTGAEQYWGNNDTEICKYANVHDEQSRLINKLPWKNAPCDDGYPKTTANGIIQTAPVGTFQKNPFHLHDMLGNVYEWVRDDGNTAGQSMMRGGSWNAAPDRVRAIGCYDQSKKYRGVDVGFRVVKYFK